MLRLGCRGVASALFHIAIGLLLGLALLGDDVDGKALAVIAVAAFLPDIDTVLAVWFPGAHRAYLHNVFVVLMPAAVLLGLRWTGRMETLKQRWPDAERVLWVAVLVMAVAGVGIDMTDSGVNLFYPMHDQFYHVSGSVQYSTQTGMQHTLFDLEQARMGSTRERYYVSAVDTGPGPEPAGVERILILFGSGTQFLVSMVTFLVVCYRMHCREVRLRYRRSIMDVFPTVPLSYKTDSQRP